jgi:glycine dehydrogenase subunit 1
VLNESFFNEMTLRLAKPAAPVVEKLAAAGILGGVPASRFYPGDRNVADLLIVAATETNTDEDIEKFATTLEGALR